ncbi:MAG: PocR ligand-binding domain-containing protein [bacterium]|nr:PocR ligand-binding domain-containing protein [bacterium]
MLSNLINLSVLERMLVYFTEATSLNVRLIDMNGQFITERDKLVNQCQFCSLVQSTESGISHCRTKFKQAILEAIRWGEPYYYICEFGLMEWVVPLVVNEEPLGALFCGQVLIDEMDDLSYEQIIRKTTAAGLSLEAVNDSLTSIKVLSGRKVKAAAELLYLIATQLIQLGYESLQQQRKITEQQMRLAEEIAFQKQGKMPIGFPKSIETELIQKVRLGDVSGAKEILNTILGTILLQDVARPQVVKARVIELVGMLARVAVEAGAQLDEIFGAQFSELSELAKIEELDQLCYWLINLLDRFSTQIYATRNIEKMKVVSRVLEYLREHYAERVTLEEVAKHVHRNPYYISHLITEQLQTTFSEYLNRIRIEKAKQLMQNPALSLAEIAQTVGFSDQSYFGRIFKREEGISPAKYRKQVI